MYRKYHMLKTLLSTMNLCSYELKIRINQNQDLKFVGNCLKFVSIVALYKNSFYQIYTSFY
jgi:hypothetical protein